MRSYRASNEHEYMGNDGGYPETPLQYGFDIFMLLENKTENESCETFRPTLRYIA